jgi:glycosyltransferase involved in cell wall biosynthesis
MSKAKVSLVMANYNHARYLKDSIPAVFSQTRPIDEVIVVDDCSTDESLEVLRAFQERFPNLRVLQNEQNRGGVRSAVRGFDESTGDFVIFHSADDVLSPNFVEKTAKMLEENPKAGLCTSYFSNFSDSTGQADDGRLNWSDVPCYLSPNDLCGLRIKGYIPGHASLYRRKAILDSGGLLPDLEWHCDWFMNNVIAARYGICFIPEPIAWLRNHDTGSYSSGRSKWEKQREVVKRMLWLLCDDSFKDVVPFFRGSQAFATFFEDIYRAIVEEPYHWSPLLLRYILAMFKPDQQVKLFQALDLYYRSFESLINACNEMLPPLESRIGVNPGEKYPAPEPAMKLEWIDTDNAVKA